MANLSPSQTIGPFFHEATRWLVQAPPAGPNTVSVEGAVLDSDGKGVSDAMLEISTASFQRVFTDDQGVFRFSVPENHVAHITLFARGLLNHLFTRLYFAESAVPAAVPAARRATLVARRERDIYRWDIRLRGDAETVFFDLTP